MPDDRHERALKTFQVPLEVVSEIISYVDQEDLPQCLRVNSTFFHAVIPRLYRHIHLGSSTTTKWPIVLSGMIDVQVAEEDSDQDTSNPSNPPVILFSNRYITSKFGDVGRSVLRRSWLERYTRTLDVQWHDQDHCFPRAIYYKLKSQGISLRMFPDIPNLETLRLTMFNSHHHWTGSGKPRWHSDVHGSHVENDCACLFLANLRPKTLVLRGANLQHWGLFPVFDAPLKTAQRLVLVFGISEEKDWVLFRPLAIPPTLENLTVVYCLGKVMDFLHWNDPYGRERYDSPLAWFPVFLGTLLPPLAAKRLAANPGTPFTITQVVFRGVDSQKAVMQAAIDRNPEPFNATARPSIAIIENCFKDRFDAMQQKENDGTPPQSPLRAISGESYLAQEDWEVAFRRTELFPKP
ncbi:hypothetical protein Q8F55_004923 [Vanrija albida]|uniref:F-box domain-containing protein n=1 Tax=Vanrija albida TaxID=181172 RepID=A0ABR3Q066_9TREE